MNLDSSASKGGQLFRKQKFFSVVLRDSKETTHSSTFVLKIPWMEEPGRLQSIGSQRVVRK